MVPEGWDIRFTKPSMQGNHDNPVSDKHQALHNKQQLKLDTHRATRDGWVGDKIGQNCPP